MYKSNSFCSLSKDKLEEINGGSITGWAIGVGVTLAYTGVNKEVKERTGQTIGSHANDAVDAGIDKISDAWDSYNEWHPLGHN